MTNKYLEKIAGLNKEDKRSLKTLGLAGVGAGIGAGVGSLLAHRYKGSKAASDLVRKAVLSVEKNKNPADLAVKLARNSATKKAFGQVDSEASSRVLAGTVAGGAAGMASGVHSNSKKK